MRAAALLLIAIMATASTVAPRASADNEGAALQTPVPFTPQAVATPAAANSAQPQLSVSKRGVLLSWIERNADLATLKFSERTATGWSTPKTIASGRDWFVNWADVPSALRLPSGALIAHWLQKSAASTYAYDVRLSYSLDDGKTWSPSFLPHHDGTPTEHGFASLFPLGDGFGLIWLDGRVEGAMSVRFARFDPSTRPDSQSASLRAGNHFKQVEESLVDGKVCECCPTTAAVTSEGIIAAYRNRSDEEIRDNYVARLVDGKWTTPQAVFSDNWKIAACPVNGPSLSASGSLVAMSWFTAAGDQGRAFAAFSQDAGKTFSSPIRIDDGGTLGRVDLELLPDGSALATWIEFADQPVAPKPAGAGGTAQFRARRIERGGKRSTAVTIAGIAGSRSSGYPRAAVANGEVVFAWTEAADAGGLQVRTAAARQPR